MKIKIKKQELRECIENAVIMALNEMQEGKRVNEGYYDDEDDDPTAAWDKELANILKNDKGRAKAKKAFNKDKEKEDAEAKHDDNALAKRAQQEKPDNED